MSTSYRSLVFNGSPKVDGADNHAHAVDFDDVEYRDCVFNANGASEAFKSSRHKRAVIAGGLMIGGVEDCEDLIECEGYEHHGVMYERGKARQDVTIKYQSRGCSWTNCVGLRMIVAGDYSIYDSKATGRPVSQCSVSVPMHHPKVVVVCINSEPWSGDVVNVRIPWRWLHFRVVAIAFWVRRTFWKERGANAAKV